MPGIRSASGAPSSPNQSDSDSDFDLFDDNDADSTSSSPDFKQRLRDRADQARRAKLAELPRFPERTCAQHRLAYMLTPEKRLQPTILADVFSVRECELVLGSVVEYVRRRGGLQTDRHEKFATTDVPVSELTQDFDDGAADDAAAVSVLAKGKKKAVGDVIQEWVAERILTQMAAAAGFRHQDLGLKDLFAVCYAGSMGEATATTKRVADTKVYPIPSKQASLALHSDGCLLSFSLLLNHHNSFEGGGTFFKGSGKTFCVEQGGLLMHDAGLERKSLLLIKAHVGTAKSFLPENFSRLTVVESLLILALVSDAGAKITSGQRIILVGFVETVDVLKIKQSWGKQPMRQR